MRFCAALACLTLTVASARALDFATDALVYWPSPDAAAIALVRELPAAVLLTPPEGAAPETLRACRDAGIECLAELAPAEDLGKLTAAVESARAAGFEGAAVTAAGDERAFAQFVAAQAGFVKLVYVTEDRLSWRAAPAAIVLRSGLWPGVKPRDRSVASASEQAWLDANAHLVAWLRGVYPERPALLSYRPDDAAGVAAGRVVPDHSIDLSFVEARAAGGNAILSFPDRYRQRLLAGEEKARAAWRSLARSIAFCRRKSVVFERPLGARVAVAAGTLQQSGEILVMMYRRNLTPAVIAAPRVPNLPLSSYTLLAAANLGPPDGASAKTMLEFAENGGAVFTTVEDGEKPWWAASGARKTAGGDERAIYSLGKGLIAAYEGTVYDTAEFALDALDVQDPMRADLRIWNADTVIGLLRRLADKRAVLTLVNYGSPLDRDFLVRLGGRFKTATLETPEAAGPAPRKAARRKVGTTEISMDGINRVAVITLAEEGL